MEFFNVLSQKLGMPIILVVPTLLKMVWIKPPPYFCTASETVREVVKKFIKTAIGSSPTHKFQELAEVKPEF